MITPTSTAQDLTTVGEYIFQATPSTEELADTLAKYAVKTLGKTNFALCFDSSGEASVSFKDNFAIAVGYYGGEINSLNCDLSARQPQF